MKAEELRFHRKEKESCFSELRMCRSRDSDGHALRYSNHKCCNGILSVFSLYCMSRNNYILYLKHCLFFCALSQNQSYHASFELHLPPPFYFGLLHFIWINQLCIIQFPISFFIFMQLNLLLQFCYQYYYSLFIKLYQAIRNLIALMF